MNGELSLLERIKKAFGTLLRRAILLSYSNKDEKDNEQIKSNEYILRLVKSLYRHAIEPDLLVIYSMCHICGRRMDVQVHAKNITLVDKDFSRCCPKCGNWMVNQHRVFENTGCVYVVDEREGE